MSAVKSFVLACSGTKVLMGQQVRPDSGRFLLLLLAPTGN